MSDPPWRPLGSTTASLKPAVTYFATLRLTDALSENIYGGWLSDTSARLDQEAKRLRRCLTPSERERILRRAHGRVEKLLDGGLGHCWLKLPHVADVARDELLAEDGERYIVHSWVVMPNHAHAIVTLPLGQDLTTTLSRWKEAVAIPLRRYSGMQDPWHPDTMNEIIAGPGRFRDFHEYVQRNPTRAGLADWKWVGGEGIPPVNVIERWGDLSIDR